jgi:hypothetical protein
MQLFHGAYDIGDMLDDVNQPDRAKAVVAKRQHPAVDIADDISRGIPIAIYPDRPRPFVPATTNV